MIQMVMKLVVLLSKTEKMVKMAKTVKTVNPQVLHLNQVKTMKVIQEFG